MSSKWLGVHTGGPHYLDHLGVLCAGLNIPLIVSERATFETAQLFYPDLLVEYRDLSEISLDFLIERADVVFHSGHYFALELAALSGNQIRTVYCPHGNSDKTPGKVWKDISLFYGEHMKDHLRKTEEVSHAQVRCGNFRSQYFHKHQERLGRLLEPLLKRVHAQTIFYAPTYDSSSFSKTAQIIEELSPYFNLWIRWHPFLEDLHPAETEKMKALCEQQPGVSNLSAFPSIYPILNKADFYLGDASSIGYDFLTFNKPLFFLGDLQGEIYGCGVRLDTSCHLAKTVATFQENEELTRRRKNLSERVFGEERSFEAIREAIKQALKTQGLPI